MHIGPSVRVKRDLKLALFSLTLCPNCSIERPIRSRSLPLPFPLRSCKSSGDPVGSLRDAFVEEIKDQEHVEQQLTKALPTMAKAATNPDPALAEGRWSCTTG